MVEPDSGQPAVRRCGFIALIGAPNVGKSTLINAIVGAKVAIVSHKVQTTRTLLRGIAMQADSQLVFIDTPGFFSRGAGSTAPWWRAPGPAPATPTSSAR